MKHYRTSFNKDNPNAGLFFFIMAVYFPKSRKLRAFLLLFFVREKKFWSIGKLQVFIDSNLKHDIVWVSNTEYTVIY